MFLFLLLLLAVVVYLILGLKIVEIQFGSHHPMPGQNGIYDYFVFLRFRGRFAKDIVSRVPFVGAGANDSGVIEPDGALYRIQGS
jgi:hypothetical protein